VVKAGIEHMLEQLDLTEEERDALEGDQNAIAALVDKLADVPTPAGPTPNQLGTEPAFVSSSHGTAGEARHDHRQEESLIALRRSNGRLWDLVVRA
jgi:hypothetical protein